MNNDNDETTGSEPSFIPAKRLLFVAAGKLAADAVQLLGSVAESLSLRVSGPFGFIQVTTDVKENVQSQTVISRRLPWDSQPSEHPFTPPEAGIDQQIRSVVRRLMSIGDALPPDAPHRRSLRVYVVIDLRCLEEIKHVLSALRGMRREELTFDVTAILLTGRGAIFEPDEERWREGRELVESATTDDFLFSRLYYMDGKNADQYWLRTEADHVGMAAAFLFHHGVSPISHHLRNHETSRISGNQPLDEVSGTFCCRMLHCDRDFVIKLVTKQMYELLFKNDKQEIPSSFDNKVITGAVGDLKTGLTKLFEESSPTGTLATSHGSYATDPVRRTVRGELEAAIEKVCKQDPLKRLPAFFEKFLDNIGLMKLRGAVRKERELRHEVAEKVRKAHRVIPVKEDVEVPRKNWIWYCGIACFAIALIAAAAGLIWFPDVRGLPLIFAVLLTGACVLEVSPQWKRFYRSSDAPGESAENQSYLRKLTRIERVFGILLSVMGGLIVAGSLMIILEQIPTLFDSQLGSVIAAVVILLGSLVPLFWPSARWHPGFGATDSPKNVAGPRPSHLRAIGGLILIGLLLALTFAWPISLRPDIPARILTFVGLAVCTGGMLLLSWPRKARDEFSAKLHTAVSTHVDVPQPSILNATSNRLLAQLEAWCHDALASEPIRSQDDYMDWPASRGFGSILDAVRQDWPKELAKYCKQDQRAVTNSASLWSDCLLKSFDRQSAYVGNYKLALAYFVVSTWVNERSWEDLVALLGKSNTDWFTHYFDSSLVPMWPDNIRQWDQDVGVAALSDGLYELVQPETERNLPYRVIPVDWPDSGLVVLVRRVQGTPCGLPGDGFIVSTSGDHPDNSAAETDSLDQEETDRSDNDDNDTPEDDERPETDSPSMTSSGQG